jgi:hypothetical protein
MAKTTADLLSRRLIAWGIDPMLATTIREVG